MARTCSFLIAYGPGDSVIWDVTVLETLDRNGFSPGWKPYCPVWTSAESSPTLTPQSLEIEKKIIAKNSNTLVNLFVFLS